MQLPRTLTSGGGSLGRLAARASTTNPRLYVAILLCSVLVALTYKLRTESIFACPASGYGPGQYLAYCQTNGYGDYDHGAFWYAMEPAAQRAAAEAEVLFIGNSRMQFALSTQATRQWFSNAAALFYLLGFAYEENAQFLAPLLGRLKPQAMVYVINIDRFFDDGRITWPTEAIRKRPSETQENYEEKQLWQVFHKGICTSVPALCGNGVAFFRSRGTGLWQLIGAENFKPAAVADGVPDAADIDRWRHYAALGEEFVSQLPVERRCIILTIAPWNGTKAAEARAIADALKLELVAPKLEGLRTIDGTHLDEASAQRWSTAFLEAAGPRILQCVREARAAAR